MPFRYHSMRERIMANSRVNSEHVHGGVPCRDWTGSVFPPPYEGAPRWKCYGRIGVRFQRGPRRGKTKSTQAHRESLKAYFKLKKPWMRLGSKNVSGHLCDRPICVEPLHLLGGTQKRNVRDCVAKGRHGNSYRSPTRL